MEPAVEAAGKLAAEPLIHKLDARRRARIRAHALTAN